MKLLVVDLGSRLRVVQVILVLAFALIGWIISHKGARFALSFDSELELASKRTRSAERTV